MNIYQLRYYIAVVEEGTISAAARKLNLLSHPCLPKSSSLEEEVGTELFIRGARQITLTPAGRRFYQYALEMIRYRTASLGRNPRYGPRRNWDRASWLYLFRPREGSL